MAKYKDVSKSKILCVDIETYDPGISDDLGPGVYRNDGYILGVAIADDAGFAEYYNIGHNDCTAKEREQNVEYLRYVLAMPMPKLGANITYDVDWLENWKGDTAKFAWRGKGLCLKVNGDLYDIQVAEPLLDENQGQYSLDFQAHKYLGKGKFKTEIDEYCAQNGWTGDARKWLWKMPYFLVYKYALDDVREPLAIFDIQWKLMEEQDLIPLFKMETDLLRAKLHMQMTGTPVDASVRDVNSYLATCRKEECEIAFEREHGKINLNSPKQLKELFDRLGIQHPYKFTYTNNRGKEVEEIVSYEEAQDIMECIKEGTMSDTLLDITGGRHKALGTCRPTIGKDFFEAIDKNFGDDEDVEMNKMLKDILFIRKANKMIGTFLQGSLKKTMCPDGRIHPTIHTMKTDDYGTRSGRFSMSNPNLQQIPSTGRDKYWGKLCREPFKPLPNCWWVKLDYSQVEYRCLAHYASGTGSRELVDTYNNDPHTDYHQYIMNLTGLGRSSAKNMNFGCMYGMGRKKMSRLFGWAKDYAEAMLSVYHENAPYVKMTMNSVGDVAKSRGYIRTLAGRRSRLIDRDKTYIMMNRLIQGSAADIMKKAMVDVYKSGVLDTLSWHLTVHDELDISVPKTAKGIREVFRVKSLMENAYKLRVPLKAELELGADWASVSEIDFTDLDITQEDWLAGLTDENVEEEVGRIIQLCKDIKAEKKAKATK